VAKNSKDHPNGLDIPTQLSRRVRRFSARSRQLTVGKIGTSRQCSGPPGVVPTSTGDMSVESESYLMIGSRDLQQRIRFESACRSLMPADTFFALTSRA
jgi:hypothetical protein